MNRLIRETDQVIKLNLRQLAVFEVLFRLVAGTFYIRLANQLLRFSLRMAGYSYLTMSNMGAFLWRPLTIVCVAAIIAVGMVLMVVEIAGLITAYQASAYSRRIDSLSILKGAVDKVFDEWKKRNWKLLPLAFADFLMMNSFMKSCFPFPIHVYLSDLRPPLRTLWHICKMKGNNCIAYQKMIIHSFVTMLS